jgi:hypothetical protein
MVKAAMEQEMQQQRMNALVEGLKNQMFVSIFTRCATEHMVEGEELSLDSGRELANDAASIATQVVQQYSPFLFEKMGLAKLDKV